MDSSVVSDGELGNESKYDTMRSALYVFRLQVVSFEVKAKGWRYKLQILLSCVNGRHSITSDQCLHWASYYRSAMIYHGFGEPGLFFEHEGVVRFS